MGTTSLYAIPLLLSISSAPIPLQYTEPGPPRPGGYLFEEDAVYLEYLLQDFLFDPRRAVRVRLQESSSDDCDGQYSIRRLRALSGRTSEGWLVRGRDGSPDRVYFTDGGSIPAGTVKPVVCNFEQCCAHMFCGDKSGFDPADDPLALAAWLHRRGFDNLAARALAAARSRDEDPRERLREKLARHAITQFRSAFISHADLEALAHAERLSRLYPEYVEEYRSLPLIVADLKRRQRDGTLGKSAEKSLPREFAKWDVQARLKYLIRSLEDIDELSSDEVHIAALVDLGDAAVPALIDVLEHDDRLARGPRLNAFGPFRHRRYADCVSVGSLALEILGAILRVEYLDPYNDAVKVDGEFPAGTATDIRLYWARYGHLPFNDRMMSVLTDSNARVGARIDAAEELIAANQVSPRSWTKERRHYSGAVSQPSALLAKYTSPTVQQAIFDAMNQERARHKSGLTESRDNRERMDSRFVHCLVSLGDSRAGPELALRAAQASSSSKRFLFARAAHELGVSGELVSVIRDIGAGRFELSSDPASDSLVSFDGGPFGHLVAQLIRCGLPEADEALYLLADPRHPLYPLAAASALKEDNIDRWSGSSPLRHPVRLMILAQRLTDFQTTGVHYYLRGDEIEVMGGQDRRRTRYRDKAPATAHWLEHAEQRVADKMADRLAQMVVGLTTSHPLRPDADARLAKVSAEIALYSRRFRHLDWKEMDHWNLRFLDTAYIPDLRPLGRPATDADVKLGRAVFELNGRGAVPKLKLPVWLVLKSEAKERRPSYGLVVQAETDLDGKLVYGVIFRHEIRAVRADEVARIEPYDKE